MSDKYVTDVTITPVQKQMLEGAIAHYCRIAKDRDTMWYPDYQSNMILVVALVSLALGLHALVRRTDGPGYNFGHDLFLLDERVSSVMVNWEFELYQKQVAHLYVLATEYGDML
jgi:hypothetical protein